MADNINADISRNSHYRVAFDLMERIAAFQSTQINPENALEYFLTLYEQCLDVVYRGKSYSDVVKPKQPSSGNYY